MDGTRYEADQCATHMDMHKVRNLARVVCFPEKIRYESSFPVYNESVPVNSR
jgi:hypothetical protein